MNQELIVTNLKRLRSVGGLTQEELAERAGLSRAGYRNIETGRTIPRSSTLEALAEALDVPLRELLTPIPVLQYVRFRSFKRLRTREGILADVGRWLADFNELEDILEDRRHYSLSGLIPADREGRGAATAAVMALAEEVRARFGLGLEEPIRDICGLLEANGIKVLPLQVASDAFFGLSVAAEAGGPAVVVNNWERISVERWIFSAAHELGHLVLHIPDYQIERAEEAELPEKEANLFANHFLMPEKVFWAEWTEARGLPLVDRVLKVKRIFQVSYKTVLYRLAERARPEINVWQRFQNDYRARHGRTLMKEDEPEALAADAFQASFPEASKAREPEDLSGADFVEDRLSRLVREAVEAGAISLGRAAEVLRLSLPEMRALAGAWVE
jgi:Zn-dependent peptidase ImmA (M78 family)/transcriptional regulator with XRE-family HTH domain